MGIRNNLAFNKDEQDSIIVSKDEQTPYIDEMSILLNERKILEASINNKLNILSEERVTMDSPLLTPDGFPRDDIDIPTVRKTRSEIRTLEYDLQQVMKRLEELLYSHHENLKKQKNISDQNSSSNDSRIRIAEASSFAIIDEVSDKSPAMDANLQPGDKIISFGTCTKHTKNISKVLAEESMKEIVPVTLLRLDIQAEKTIINTNLHPNPNWGGRGRLGFHLSFIK